MNGPMTRRLSGAILTALVLACGSQGAAPAIAAEVIHSFDSEVQVAKNGELAVTETIAVRAEGRRIKRGIFRDFPLTFTDADGNLHEVSFDLIDVSRDGKPEPHFTRRKGGVLRIYAGDKDVLIPRGDHTYVFRYRTGRQIRWFDGKPELNWNVTGNFWDFPIRAAHYRLRLIDNLRPTRWTAFTGVRGARGTGTVWQSEDSVFGSVTLADTKKRKRVMSWQLERVMD